MQFEVQWSKGPQLLRSQANTIELVDIVHAALTVYDLPELAASLGQKVSIAAEAEKRQ
jgi:hypothetical protein